MASNEANTAKHDDDLRRQLADPQALAVQERFLAEWRAGRRPRLSVYARRYPAYAEALADVVAALPPDTLGSAQASIEVGDADEPGRTPAESFPGRPALMYDNDFDTGSDAGYDAGVDRALAAIFGVTTPGASAGERSLPQVAERAADYLTTSPDTPDAPAEPTQPPQPPARPERD